MLPHGPRRRCAGPLVTVQRNPACSDPAPLLRPEQRLKGNCLCEVNVEASRFMELKRVREEFSYV